MDTNSFVSLGYFTSITFSEIIHFSQKKMSHYDDLPDCQNNFFSSVREIEKERKLLIKLYNNLQTTITSCTGKKLYSAEEMSISRNGVIY